MDAKTNANVSNNDLLRRIAELEAELAKKASGHITFKVSEKGAVSAYGLGRFPVTLYGEQWVRLLDKAAEIRSFLTAHKGELAVKGETKTA